MSIQNLIDDSLLPPLTEGRPLTAAEFARFGGTSHSDFVISDPDAIELSLTNRLAGSDSAIGVYRIVDGRIDDPRVVLSRVGDRVDLQDVYDDLSAGDHFGIFLIHDGNRLNPPDIFDSANGSLRFVDNGADATISSHTPQLIFEPAAGGTAIPVRGFIHHSTDGGSENPASNKLNLGDQGQVISGPSMPHNGLDVRFEDLPADISDRDFGDYVVNIVNGREFLPFSFERSMIDPDTFGRLGGTDRALFNLEDLADASFSVETGTASFNSLTGVYLIDSEGHLTSPKLLFEASQDDFTNIRLSDLYSSEELSAASEFAVFLVANGANLNDMDVIGNAQGTLDFRDHGGQATLHSRAPDLVFTGIDGAEHHIRGNIFHAVDAGSVNPGSNRLNDGGFGQAISGFNRDDNDLLEVRFEDLRLDRSDGDFEDVRLYIHRDVDGQRGDVSSSASLAPGEQVQGEIDFGKDSDWFRIHLDAGENYQFNMNRNDGAANPLRDPFLRLFDGQGRQITFNDDASTLNSEIFFTAPVSGAYFLGAESFHFHKGGYLLSAKQIDLSNDLPADATTPSTLAIGGSLVSEIDIPFDVDWHRIQVEDGANYGFTLAADQSAINPLFGGSLRLVDADGNTIGSTGFGDTIFYESLSDAVLFLEVNNFGASAGSYLLSAEEIEDAVPGDTSSTALLAAGGNTSGSIDFPFDEDWFRIDLEQTTAYRFGLIGDETSPNELVDPYLRIYNSAGELVDENDDFNGLDSQLDFNPDASGAFFVSAGGFSANTGDFILQAEEVLPGLALFDVDAGGLFAAEHDLAVPFAAGSNDKLGTAATSSDGKLDMDLLVIDQVIV